MSRSRIDRGHRRWFVRAALALALTLVTWAPISVGMPLNTARSEAATVSTCLPNELNIAIDFNGPGNPDGAIVLNTSANQTCVLSGQPGLKFFNTSNRQLKLSESRFQFTPALPPPATPILLTPSAPWAVVEMSWCGFPGTFSRVGLRFRGWRHSLSIKENSFGVAAFAAFTPPACSSKRKSQLSVDFVRKLTAKGIAGRSPTVTVSPSNNLHNGEKVSVTVSGFDIGAKFFLSECADARDVNSGGCGQQLAAQPFGLTNMLGTGSYDFDVKSTVAANDYHLRPLYRCRDDCVLVATGGFGGSVWYARLRFV
jgi:hypothetical protein